MEQPITGALSPEACRFIVRGYLSGTGIQTLAQSAGVAEDEIVQVLRAAITTFEPLPSLDAELRRPANPPRPELPVRNRTETRRARRVQPLLECEACGWRPPRRYPTLIVCHFIVPVAAGGSEDPSNRIHLCFNHHALCHVLFRPTRAYRGPRDRDALLEALWEAEE